MRQLSAAERTPPRRVLAQAVLIFGLSLLGMYYPYNRGALLTSVVVFYALTAGVAGYVRWVPRRAAFPDG